MHFAVNDAGVMTLAVYVMHLTSLNKLRSPRVRRTHFCNESSLGESWIEYMVHVRREKL